jgi:hypothetical protein
LVIDRPTDGPTFQKYFEITSTTGGSFYVGNQSINMFTTTLGSVAASQFIWFDGITFEQEFTSNATYVALFVPSLFFQWKENICVKYICIFLIKRIL